MVLLQTFKEHEFFIGSPLLIEDWVIELVDDVILVGKLVDIGKTTDTKIALFCQNFGVFADIAFTVVALYLVGGVDDVLGGGKGT